MLSHIHIRNFQSLHDVSLDLKPLTVIVGPSSSGKSAVTRAIGTLTSNRRGTAFITHGENQTVIKAKTDRGTVALLRGRRDEYVIIPEDRPELQKSFTKLGGNTPEEVSEFIGIPAKDPLNYSSQFDMPYLLTSSAAEVARTLGELTNVSVVFDAAREANRRRLQAAGVLKTRSSDLEKLLAGLENFSSLEEDLRTAEQCQGLLEHARELEKKFLRLSEILAEVEEIPEVPSPKKIPSSEEAEQAAKKLATVSRLIEELRTATEAEEAAKKKRKTEKKKVALAEEAYVEALRQAGTCPTCGQSTEHVH